MAANFPYGARNAGRLTSTARQLEALQQIAIPNPRRLNAIPTPNLFALVILRYFASGATVGVGRRELRQGRNQEMFRQ